MMVVNTVGARTILAVPMLRENELMGAFVIFRQVVRPFTEKQIDLVTNFASQAVIAIENTRLLDELRQRTDDLSEALEQQTATSEVLRVISASPGELEPVFKSVLENATQICEASFGNLLLYDGDVFRRVALHNPPPAWAADSQRDPVIPRGAMPYRVAETEELVHVLDLAADTHEGAQIGGGRGMAGCAEQRLAHRRLGVLDVSLPVTRDAVIDPGVGPTWCQLQSGGESAFGVGVIAQRRPGLPVSVMSLGPIRRSVTGVARSLERG